MSGRKFKILEVFEGNKVNVSVERIELESDFSSINLKIKRKMINIIISTKFRGGGNLRSKTRKL